MNESKVLGKFARLYVSKITKFGVMLRSFEEKDLEVLLPNNQVKKGPLNCYHTKTVSFTR